MTKQRYLVSRRNCHNQLVLNMFCAIITTAERTLEIIIPNFCFGGKETENPKSHNL